MVDSLEASRGDPKPTRWSRSRRRARESERGRDKKETGRASSVWRTGERGRVLRVQTWREQLYKCRKKEETSWANERARKKEKEREREEAGPLSGIDVCVCVECENLLTAPRTNSSCAPEDSSPRSFQLEPQRAPSPTGSSSRRQIRSCKLRFSDNKQSCYIGVK